MTIQMRKFPILKITPVIFCLLIVVYSMKSSIATEGKVCTPTQNDIEGPYYLPGAPFRTQIADPYEPGEHIVIKGSVLDTDCRTPLKGALVEVWQTDSSGEYHDKDEGYRLRGQMKTDDNGHFEFSSVKPGRYRIMSGFRPAHIHFKVSHPGHEVLVTQLYFYGDPYLWPNDACGKACKSNDQKRIIELKSQKRGGKVFLEGLFPVFLKKRDK